MVRRRSNRVIGTVLQMRLLDYDETEIQWMTGLSPKDLRRIQKELVKQVRLLFRESEV